MKTIIQKKMTITLAFINDDCERIKKIYVPLKENNNKLTHREIYEAGLISLSHSSAYRVRAKTEV